MNTNQTTHKGIEIEVYRVEPEGFVAAAIVEKESGRWDILTTSNSVRDKSIETIKRKIDQFLDNEK